MQDGIDLGRKLALTFNRKYFYVLEENQGVFHMAVEISDLDDPPVLFRFYEKDELWHLHAYTFSEWLLAIVWDSLYVENFNRINTGVVLNRFLEEYVELGPHTLQANMWMYASEFFRGSYNGERTTFAYS